MQQKNFSVRYQQVHVKFYKEKLDQLLCVLIQERVALTKVTVYYMGLGVHTPDGIHLRPRKFLVKYR